MRTDSSPSEISSSEMPDSSTSSISFFNLTNIHEWVPYSLFSVIVTGVSPPSVKRMPRQLYSDKFQQAGTPVYFAPECQC